MDDLLYPLAVRNPFDPNARGCRVPQIIAEPTITYTSYDEESI